ISPSTLPSTLKSSLPVISPLTCRLAPSRAAAPLDGVEECMGSFEFIAIDFASQFGGSVFAGNAADFSGTAGLAGGSGRLSLVPHIWPLLGFRRRTRIPAKCASG